MTLDQHAQASFTIPMGMLSRIHFIGIGGSGMNGIAHVLLNLGYQVSGSDLRFSPPVRALEKQGATVYEGHNPSHVVNSDVVVVSSAIHDNNVELRAARDRAIPIVPRAEMLGELMRFRHGIAIAGTHGKTTTTSLIASILIEGGLDPTFVIGGKLNSCGGYGHLGKGRYLVAEADESDASFLFLHPVTAVVTNIDRDHLDTYGGNFQRLQTAFAAFLHQLPFYGSAVICQDDPVLRQFPSRVNRHCLTYGIETPAMTRASNISFHDQRVRFMAHLPHWEQALPIDLNLPGRYNVLNALGALTVGAELGLPRTTLQSALSSFAGISRRFHVRRIQDERIPAAWLVDDYAHHPREIDAVMEAVREIWPRKPVTMVFQPHRYSRTCELFDSFISVLSQCDRLILCDVYPAGEPPMPEYDSDQLAHEIEKRTGKKPFRVTTPLEAMIPLRARIQYDDEIVLVLGAGDIAQLAEHLSKDYRAVA